AQEAIDIRGMLSQMPGAENIFEKAQSAAAENLTKIVDKWWDKISKYNSKTDPIKSLGGGDGGGELGTPENIGITPNSEFQLPEEDPELLALIEAAPGINEYETILLKHIDGLVCISADVLPSLIRLLPAIKSGDLEAIGDSQDFTVLLQALREGIIKDEALRTDLIGLFGDWLKQASTQAIKEQTNDSIPPEVLNTLASDIDRLLTDPENQITLLNIILDDNVFPKILSGEDLDLATEAKIIGSLGAKGYSLWNLNHLQTTLSNFWGGMTTEVTTNLLWDSLTGPETEEEEETTDLTASIPDFLGEQANADQVALFFEENQDLLEAAGEDLPVLYLAVRALFNKDFDNPAINALANNESFGIMLTALREFTDQNSAFQEGVLEASGKGIVMVLKSFAPENESRDWDSIEGEINGLIAASPELQNDYLDFVFLQFDKGSFVEALQGNIDPLQLAGETLSIPFIRNLTNQLGNREQTPNLRTLLTETGIHAGLSLLGEEMQENEDWPILEAELRQLAENPELQDAFFGLLKEGNSTELLTGFQKIMAGDYLDGASTLLSNQNIQIILSELREFVRETDKTEEFLLNIAIVNLGDYLNDVYPQMANSALTESLRQIVVGNDVMRENILQLALNPYKINQVIEITRNITPENLEETVIALRDIPELNAILDNLPDILASDQGPSVVIKENITKVALNFATQNIPILQTPEGQELLQTIRPQITTFLRDSDVLQTGVA
ncbi:hypothetical protein HN680_04835, partial [Candidatus Peregrinibacteria bacterium]|nr:hypothetical protein [Candidatus Peregrinibacteria bacterium]